MWNEQGGEDSGRADHRADHRPWGDNQAGRLQDDQGRGNADSQSKKMNIIGFLMYTHILPITGSLQ